MSVLSVQCPTCKRKVQWIPDNQFRPFCSQRCREADMGAWASESYRIGNATEADQNELGYDRSDKPGG